MSTTTARQFAQVRQRIELRRKFDKWLKRYPFPHNESNEVRDAWVKEAQSISIKLGLSEVEGMAMIQMAKGVDYITFTGDGMLIIG